MANENGSHTLRCVAASFVSTRLTCGIIIATKAYNMIVEWKNATSHKNLF